VGVLLVLISLGLGYLAVSGKARRSSGAAPATSSTSSDLPSVATSSVARGLDGVLVAPEEARLPVYGIMVENHVDARPLSGPAAANVAIEAPVEGGITRFLLFFDATTTVDAIGPVRSARPYFVDFARGLGAIYGHVGGSPEALRRIQNLSEFRDLNEYFNGKFFWRSSKRSAPHNAFTRSDLLASAASFRGWETGAAFVSWKYKDEASLDGGTGTSTLRGFEDGPHIRYGGSYNVSWAYDRPTNAYTRLQAGKEQKDQDGSGVYAKNIVVMLTDGKVLDAEGRLEVRTTGKGKAVIYRDGMKTEGVWRRAEGEWLGFEGMDGSDILLNRGTTWIEVVIDPTMAE
jgi:hypothetical protein